MAKRREHRKGAGPQPTFDPEAMFVFWFNDGERRKYMEVVGEFGCSYETVKRNAGKYDWERRADEIDVEVRKLADKKLATLIFKHRANEIRAIPALHARFLSRLKLVLDDGTPNPDYLHPSEMTVRDFSELAKLFELLTGGVTARIDTTAGDGNTATLEEVALEMEELELEELRRTSAADTTMDEDRSTEGGS